MRVRHRESTTDSSGHRVWRIIEGEQTLVPERTAVLLCDVWDGHWCRGAVERLELMLPRINAITCAMRTQGAAIIHAPSDTLDFYRETEARRRMTEVPRISPPEPAQLPDPPLPIDDTNGGCDTDNNYGHPNERRWNRQHPDIYIDETQDVMSDDGEEIYSFIVQRKLETLVFMGVHTNMCVLNRSFGIKNLVRWGVNTVLCRDLTDAMYDPACIPYVSHQGGTDLVIEYIEKFWCPSTTSAELSQI